ncbi:MAG TPA: glycosyltransferase [Terrimicrobiaceae bacterium]
MRILQVTPYYFPEVKFGGPPRKIHAISTALRERGHYVTVLTFHSERPFSRERLDIDGVTVQYLPWAGKKLRQVSTKLEPIAKSVQHADVVHLYGLYNLLCPIAAWISHTKGIPYFLEPLGMFVPRARNLLLKSLYNRLVTSWMSRRAAGVIATSPAEREDLNSVVEEGRLTLRRNGINPAKFQNLPSGTIFRRRHRVPEGSRIVLYVGRISPIKNLEQLLLAFANAELENTVLVLAGPLLEPDYERKIRSLIRDKHLEPCVFLTGPIFGEQKLSALAAAELFVLPSLNESFGNAAAEAVAAGLPVLLTKQCGIAPFIHLRAGYSVPLGTNNLEAGLRMMMSDLSQRAALTAEREAVIRELCWSEPVRQTEELYRNALDAATRKPRASSQGVARPAEVRQ